VRLCAVEQLAKQASSLARQCPRIEACDRTQCDSCAIDNYRHARAQTMRLVAEILQSLQQILTELDDLDGGSVPNAAKS